MRLLVTAAAAALAAVCGAAVGTPGPVQIRPVVFTVPLPLDPAPPAQDLPTVDQVSRILTDLADPGVPDKVKNPLVQGGVNSGERRAFTRDRLDKAARHGELPLSFAVGNIWSVGPGTAAAQVTVSGPKLAAPEPKVFTFIDQGHWMLSSDSAAALIETVAPD
ncbi:hypothetical protein KIH27_19565 [Mycobacterium sp. M1]|uniref:Low molecular weight antigen MTB12-like C-terminal domain-containing protein n=1 Tax=Mycolicibacter acidiphilus TaxID=2835306 RepID=A0ABS5RN98_9MYCO|nr:hypothetical protein [Mycolicibacter acidiphilus]MBS9535788.1 hypothetical protein [Mycolicibacter acidiphilus]